MYGPCLISRQRNVIVYYWYPATSDKETKYVPNTSSKYHRFQNTKTISIKNKLNNDTDSCLTIQQHPGTYGIM